MLDYIKQLEQQNEELRQKLAHSEFNNNLLRHKGHIVYELKGRIQVPDPGFSLNCTLVTSYTLRAIAYHLESILKSESLIYKSIDLKATYHYRSRDFLRDHIPGDGEWHSRSVWTIAAHLNGEVAHRPYYVINGYYFYGIPKHCLKDKHGTNLVDYLKKHIR